MFRHFSVLRCVMHVSHGHAALLVRGWCRLQFVAVSSSGGDVRPYCVCVCESKKRCFPSC